MQLLSLLVFGIFTLILAYGTFKRPAAAAGFMAIVAPLEKLSFYRGLTIKPFLIILPGFILGVAVWLLCKGKKPLRPTLFEKILLAILAVSLFSLIGAMEPMRGLRMWVQMGFLIAIAAATARVLIDERAIQTYIRCFFAGAAVSVAYGCYQLGGFLIGYNGHPLLALARLNPTLPQMLIEPGSVVFGGNQRMVRLSSFFFDWNFYGAYLVAAGALLVAYAGEKIRNDRFSISFGIPGLYALMAIGISWFLTFSRSAWLGGVVALLVLIWHRAGVQKVLQRYYSLFLAVIGALLFLNINPFTFIMQRWAAGLGGSVSTVEHATYGLAAVRMMLDHPIFGVGLHNFAPVYQALFDPNQPGATAHSSFLSLAAEVGFAGLVLYLWLFFETLGRLHGFLLETRGLPLSRWREMGTLAAILGVGVASVFYHIYTHVFIWSLLGAAWAMGESHPRAAGTEAAPSLSADLIV